MTQPKAQHAPAKAPTGPARLMDIRATWTGRGIAVDDRPAQRRMLRIADAVTGAAIAASRTEEPGVLARHVSSVAPELEGFAWEGASMAWTLADFASGKNNSAGFRAAVLAQTHANWRNWILVGMGLGLAQSLASAGADGLARVCDLTLGAGSAEAANLVADGVGYGLGASRPSAFIVRDRNPFRPRGHASDPVALAAARGFDQGIGRAVWFLDCGEPAHILTTMREFSGSEREADIWGGVGYAGAYSGGAPAIYWTPLIDHLHRTYHNHGWLAQAVACAASARARTGRTDTETVTACAATWDLEPAKTIGAMQSWLNDQTSPSAAHAPTRWLHCRVPLEFQTA